MEKFIWSVAIMGTVAAGLGCGGGEARPAASASSGGEVAAPKPVSPVSKSGSGSVDALIGSAGGRLELTEGPRVVIPAGAIEEAAEYVLKTAPITTAFFNEESERPIGPTFVLSPAVVAPDGDHVEVSMPMASLPDGWGEPAIAYEYAVGARVGAEDSVHTKWQYENAPVSNGRATARMDALTGMRLQFVLTNLEAQ
ncbi:MAG: hypothetical protein OXR73_27815 [Myxococcales bacterium]|nr:hypothetical protein [Myxococcales bacterium]